MLKGLRKRPSTRKEKSNDFFVSSCFHCMHSREWGKRIFCSKRKELKRLHDWCNKWEKKDEYITPPYTQTYS